MNKFLKVLVIPFLIMLGIVIGLLLQKAAWLNIDFNRQYGIWEILYYLVSIIGALGTCAAVVVALERDSIIRYFHHPELDIQFLEESGFVEDIDLEQQNPASDSYSCIIKIENKGSVVAKSCEVLLDQVSFAEKKGRSLRCIRDNSNKPSNKLWWESAHVEIPAGISKELKLFSIEAPGSSVTPNEVNTNTVLHLELNGFKLKDNKSSKGYWELSYYMVYDNGDHKKFKVCVEWNGEWRTRKSEMKDVLHINIQNI